MDPRNLLTLRQVSEEYRGFPLTRIRYLVKTNDEFRERCCYKPASVWMVDVEAFEQWLAESSYARRRRLGVEAVRDG